MDDLENRLSSVLGDPQQMEKITKLAQSILSGAGSGESASSEGLGFDPEMLGRLTRLMNTGEAKEEKMLEAMSPYLSEKRRDKMDKAMKIARLAAVAELAAGELGGDDDV